MTVICNSHTGAMDLVTSVKDRILGLLGHILHTIFVAWTTGKDPKRPIAFRAPELSTPLVNTTPAPSLTEATLTIDWRCQAALHKMCFTLEYYEIDFCRECRVRSAAYDRSEATCLPEFLGGTAYQMSAVNPQNCHLGFVKKHIQWQWAPEVDEGRLLNIHCIRCYKETTWHDFNRRFVTKETDECFFQNRFPS